MPKNNPKTLWELTDLFAAGKIQNPKELAAAVKIYYSFPQKSFSELLELITDTDVKNRIFSSILLDILLQNKKTAPDLKNKLGKMLDNPSYDKMTKAALLAMLNETGSSLFADYNVMLAEPLRKFTLQHLTEMFTDELLTDEIWPAFLTQPLEKQRFVLHQLRESGEPLVGSFLNWVMTQNRGPLRKEARAALRYMQANGVKIEERLTGPDPAIYMGKTWRAACAMRRDSICALVFSWQKPSGNFSLLTFTINYCSRLDSAGIIDLQFSSEVHRKDIESFFTGKEEFLNENNGEPLIENSGKDKDIDEDMEDIEDIEDIIEEINKEMTFITLEYHQALWLLQEAADLGINIDKDSLWYKFRWLLNEPVQLSEREKEDVIYRLLEDVSENPVDLADTYFQALLWNDRHLRRYLLAPASRRKMPPPPEIPSNWNLKEVSYQLLLNLKKKKDEIVLVHAVTSEKKKKTFSYASHYIFTKRNKNQLYIKNAGLKFMGELKKDSIISGPPFDQDFDEEFDGIFGGNFDKSLDIIDEIKSIAGEINNMASEVESAKINRQDTEILKAVNRFWTEEIKQSSRNTQRKYNEALGILLSYCKWAGLDSVEELDEEALEEFLSWWYIQEYLYHTPFKARQLLSGLKRFFKWCSKNVYPEAQKRYAEVYRKLKDDLPRCLEACDMINNSAKPFFREASAARTSWFELVRKDKRGWQVQDIINDKEYYPLNFSSQAEKFLRQGDIVNLLLVRRNDKWVVKEAGLVHPQTARLYIE